MCHIDRNKRHCFEIVFDTTFRQLAAFTSRTSTLKLCKAGTVLCCAAPANLSVSPCPSRFIGSDVKNYPHILLNSKSTGKSG